MFDTDAAEGAISTLMSYWHLTGTYSAETGRKAATFVLAQYESHPAEMLRDYGTYARNVATALLTDPVDEGC